MLFCIGLTLGIAGFGAYYNYNLPYDQDNDIMGNAFGFILVTQVIAFVCYFLQA